MKRYTLENKPNFQDGELVYVDMSCFGYGTDEIKVGTVVGKSFTHIIDFWLVEFKEDFSPTYPYKVLPVQHTFILDDN